MDQTIVFITLAITFILFILGKWRYDFVAMLALLVLVITDIIPSSDAFLGFAHPAVLTVAAVLLISRSLQVSGPVNVLGRLMSRAGQNFYVFLTTLCLITAIASAFINNIGALAILMPVAIHVARKHGHPPSQVLMPLAFSSLLGGMMTLIGTPPNIIIATFRGDMIGEPFGMFDFAPAGLSVTIIGILFVTLVGWRLIPNRQGDVSDSNLFEIENYITEVKISEDSKIQDKKYGELAMESEADILLLGLVRNGRRIYNPSTFQPLRTDDILILEADAENLEAFIEETGVTLAANKKARKEAEGSEDIITREAVIMADSPLIGNNARELNLRTRYGVNLLAIARSGEQIRQRIGQARFQQGDVILIQGHRVQLEEMLTLTKCLPLVERDLSIGKPRQTILSFSIFIITILAVITGLLPVETAFVSGALLMVLTGVLPVKDLYSHIDWPVIVLLGAMIPVGGALETSGGADSLASLLLTIGADMPVWLIVALLMFITMLISDLINNAATVVLMAPIGITLAGSLGVSADPLLMAIAIGGSSAFLTPIGHQSNTLVMGPGGYKFGDYWKMGLPLEILIIVVATPLILIFFPA